MTCQCMNCRNHKLLQANKVNKIFSLEKKITSVNIDLFTYKNSGMCLGYTLERVKERKNERKNAA